MFTRGQYVTDLLTGWNGTVESDENSLGKYSVLMDDGTYAGQSFSLFAYEMAPVTR